MSGFFTCNDVNLCDTVYIQELPAVTPVKCISPSNLFGEAVSVLEYLLIFKPLFNFELPDDLSLGKCS